MFLIQNKFAFETPSQLFLEASLLLQAPQEYEHVLRYLEIGEMTLLSLGQHGDVTPGILLVPISGTFHVANLGIFLMLHDTVRRVRPPLEDMQPFFCEGFPPLCRYSWGEAEVALVWGIQRFLCLAIRESSLLPLSCSDYLPSYLLPLAKHSKRAWAFGTQTPGKE